MDVSVADEACSNRKKKNGLQSKRDIMTLPAEAINNIIGGERRLLSKAKLVSTEFGNRMYVCM